MGPIARQDVGLEAPVFDDQLLVSTSVRRHFCGPALAGVSGHGQGVPRRSGPVSEPKDRTGKVTVHPELLDNEGKITKALLTVRFGGDDEVPRWSPEPALNKLGRGAHPGIVLESIRDCLSGSAHTHRRRSDQGGEIAPRFRLRLVKEDPVRLELSLTPAYGRIRPGGTG